MNLSDILSNPVRTRIVQYLQSSGEATTKQITEALKDIPTPTIYRHINFLLKEDVLMVKEERKIRGTTERLLAINTEMWSAEINRDIAATAYQFLMSLYGQFQNYASKKNTDPVADMLCLKTCMMRLSDESFEGFLKEYAELLGRYQRNEENGKVRSVSIISAPVEEEAE